VDTRAKQEFRELMAGLPWSERLLVVFYLRYLLVRQRVLGFLHRTRIALPWTYRLISAEVHDDSEH